MKRFNRSVGGRAITKQEFFPVFNTAWNRAMTPANIKAGFKRTGIWPPDIEAIPDELFAVCEQCESSGSVLMLKELVQLCFSVCVCPYSITMFSSICFMLDVVHRFSLDKYILIPISFLLQLQATFQQVYELEYHQLPQLLRFGLQLSREEQQQPLLRPLLLLKMMTKKTKVGSVSCMQT